MAATLYDRWAAQVKVSTEHADFFVRNLVAISAKKRIGLAVKQPLALIMTLSETWLNTGGRGAWG